MSRLRAQLSTHAKGLKILFLVAVANSLNKMVEQRDSSFLLGGALEAMAGPRDLRTSTSTYGVRNSTPQAMLAQSPSRSSWLRMYQQEFQT